MARKLFLISGDAEKILSHLKPAETSVIAIGEKDFKKPMDVARRLRETNTEIVFGTLDLNLQRYRFILKACLFLGDKWRGTIADEQGRKIAYNPISFLLVDSPRLVLEAMATFWVIALTSFELKRLKV
ncbi:MAG: hypothetical protein HGB19_09990 [Chlorobiales bacterium]|nr:hypothetical protein [Chlorobiales bacterium]